LISVDGQLEQVSVLQCADFRGLEEAYRHFSEQTSLVADRLAVAVACPVHQDLVKLTNNHWSFRKGQIVDALGLSELLVINDFTAQSLAVVSVPESSFEVLQEGISDPLAPLFVIGPGTGLGVGGVVVDADGECTPLSTEGGHVTMAAQTEDEWQLLSCVRNEFPHVSAERLISGPGLHLMYRTLCTLEGQSPKVRDTASMMLIADTDRLVQQTLDLFAGFFGTVASDGCLTLGATGGCFVAGGVIPKLGVYFRRDIFLDRFKAKGRFHQYLSHIPIRILLDSEAGLFGLQRALSTRSLACFSVRAQ
jgi:glucokinase